MSKRVKNGVSIAAATATDGGDAGNSKVPKFGRGGGKFEFSRGREGVVIVSDGGGGGGADTDVESENAALAFAQLDERVDTVVQHAAARAPVDAARGG